MLLLVRAYLDYQTALDLYNLHTIVRTCKFTDIGCINYTNVTINDTLALYLFIPNVAKYDDIIIKSCLNI